MEMKLCQYGRNHQPGGISWDPDQSVRAVLEQLSPVYETILGLNNYLNAAIPNMHQSAQSTLSYTVVGRLTTKPAGQSVRLSFCP